MQTQKLRHEPIFANKRLVEQRWDERHIYTKYNRKQMCYGTAARSYQQIEQTRTSTPSTCNLPELRLELLPSAPDEGVASADGQRHNGHERNSYMDIAELVWAILMRLGLPICRLLVNPERNDVIMEPMGVTMKLTEHCVSVSVYELSADKPGTINGFQLVPFVDI